MEYGTTLKTGMQLHVLGRDAGKSGDRLSHDIAMHLKDSNKKFSVDLGEFCMDFFDKYSQVAKEYGLSSAPKLQVLRNYSPRMRSASTWPKSRHMRNHSSRRSKRSICNTILLYAKPESRNISTIFA